MLLMLLLANFAVPLQRRCFFFIAAILLFRSDLSILQCRCSGAASFSLLLCFCPSVLLPYCSAAAAALLFFSLLLFSCFAPTFPFCSAAACFDLLLCSSCAVLSPILHRHCSGAARAGTGRHGRSETASTHHLRIVACPTTCERARPESGVDVLSFWYVFKNVTGLLRVTGGRACPT